jgi:magnesium transporter
VSAARALAADFARAHAEEAARFFETTPAAEMASWLAELPTEDAAALFSHAVPVAAADALAHMQRAAAAAILAELAPRAAASLLRRLPSEHAAEILARMPQAAARRIETLSRYREDQAASRLDPRAPAVPLEATASEALQAVRRAAEGALSYVYVIRDGQRLCGVASMRELMLADPDAPLRSVMVENPLRVLADTPLEAAIRHPGWRKAHALPVVDSTGNFLGVIRYSQLRALETELGQAPAAHGTQAASALAELFWLGGAAIARLGEAAVFGSKPAPKHGGEP